MNSPNITLLAKNDDIVLCRVKSFTDETVDYGVDICLDDGTVFCECPHFINRLQTEKWGRAKIEDNAHHCKHIMEVLQDE